MLFAISLKRYDHSPLTSHLSFFQGQISNDKATFQQYAVAPADITAKVSVLRVSMFATGLHSSFPGRTVLVAAQRII